MTDPHVLRGIAVSPGIAIGPLYVVHTELPEVFHRVIRPDQIDGELSRLHGAIASVRQKLEEFRERTERRAGPEEAKIFDAQIMMLEDQTFLQNVEELIKMNQLTAERAFEFQVLEMRALWAQSDSVTLRQRVADLHGIQIRVLQKLMGQGLDSILSARDQGPGLVITRELTPDLTIQFEKNQVVGIASEQGTRTSHAAILARSLGIPCVMGLVGAVESVESGTMAILDGSRGTVLTHPTDAEIDEARARERRRSAASDEFQRVVGEPSVTEDDATITLRSNVDLPEDLDTAADTGAEGVGLLRTEFLMLGRTELPREEEQFGFYNRIGARFPGYPIVIRSYDLGGDKFPAAFRSVPEPNPFLGWRAIRVCLDEPDIFRTQIRAVLRARAHADLRLMLPLVTQVEEIDRTREIVADEITALHKAGIESASELPVGVMVETPAAALLVEQMAARSNFLSVGTNDLTQYTLAVDRSNARLATRFSARHPAVIRLLKRIVDAGNEAGLEVSVCGEMASEPLSAFLLLGLGYRVLSVAPPSLSLVRWLVRHCNIEWAEQAASDALQAPSEREATARLVRCFEQHVDLKLFDDQSGCP